MANPPAISKSWNDIGGVQNVFAANYWTWAQARVAVSSLGGSPPNFTFGLGSHSATYDDAPDTKGKIFRGVPFGVGANFYTEPEDPPSTAIKWYFFWGGYYESPPDSGNYVQGIGAALADTEIGLILDGVTVNCQATSFVSGPAARDASGKGQFIGSFPGSSQGPGAITSMTTP